MKKLFLKGGIICKFQIPLIVVIIYSLLSTPCEAANTTLSKWISYKEKPIGYYIHQDVNKEIHLKIYPTNRIERIEYTYSNNNCFVKIFVGTYSYNYKNKAYKALFGSEEINFYERKEALAITKYEDSRSPYYTLNQDLNNWLRPFYFNPKSDVLVNNPTTPDHLDLNDLVFWLTCNKSDNKAKVRSIEEFVARSIEYDYDGYLTGNCHKDNRGPIERIADDKRYGVCIDYANILKAILDVAKIKSYVICGKARNSATSSLSGHAWNIIEINKVKELHDLTWADGRNRNSLNNKWLNANPQLFIASHFPDDDSDQLLLKKVSYKEFETMPFIEPSDKNGNKEYYYSPKSSFICSKDYFEFEIDTALWPISLEYYSYKNMFISIYTHEMNVSKSYHLKGIEMNDKYLDPKKGCYHVRVKNMNEEYVLFVNCRNNIEIDYKIFDGNKDDYDANLLKECNKKYIESYMSAVAVAIKQGNEKEFKRITGKSFNDYFNDSEILVAQNSFQNWNYFVGQLMVNKHINFKSFEEYSNYNKNNILDPSCVTTISSVLVNNYNFEVHQKPDKTYVINKIYLNN